MSDKTDELVRKLQEASVGYDLEDVALAATNLMIDAMLRIAPTEEAMHKGITALTNDLRRAIPMHSFFHDTKGGPLQ